MPYFFQEPGCQAMRRPRQAEEKEVGLGREYGGARQGGEPAEQVVRRSRFRVRSLSAQEEGCASTAFTAAAAKAFTFQAGKDCRSRSASGAAQMEKPHRTPAMPCIGQGAQNHQVGKEGASRSSDSAPCT